MLLHLTEARYVEKYRVAVSFNDGRAGIVDLSQDLIGPIFRPLKDPTLFSQLRLDPERDTIAWPNGADLAPEYLYFWASQG
jgi:hypothetical protein